ncbi:hypothetical protein SFOMI_3431 [Sphingobium fuliginis]|uniref:Uncharacterized protein n=1 Tax=Sphingobium fuliginis (strain ATCC 27551) TaxID=336203 RepID=A0A292ZJ43_SPHSA|nr:hypothetical protein SFOMI_3431 [Sphingobium fuliginis]
MTCSVQNVVNRSIPLPLTVVAARRGHGSPQDSKSARDG